MSITVNQYDVNAPVAAKGSVVETAAQTSAQTSIVEALIDVSKSKETVLLAIEALKLYIIENPWPA